MRKYNSVGVWYDRLKEEPCSSITAISAKALDYKEAKLRYIYFASTLEFHVWVKLTRIYGEKNVKSQHSILVRPASRNWDRVFWKCDFLVTPISLLVEAKGYPTPDFYTKLQFLDEHNAQLYDKLLIVFASGSDGYKLYLEKGKKVGLPKCCLLPDLELVLNRQIRF